MATQDPPAAPVLVASTLGILDKFQSSSSLPYRDQFSAPGSLERPTRRAPSRPSTAPSKDKSSVLPSFATGWVMSDERPLVHQSLHSKTQDVFTHMNAVKQDESGTSLGALPSPFDADHDMINTDNTLTSMHSEYDWAAFIYAYANGQWDPHRTPSPPRSCQSSFTLSTEAPGFATTRHDSDIHLVTSHSETRSDDMIRHSESRPSSAEASPILPPAAARSSTSTISISPSSSLRRFRPAAPPYLPMPAHRMRNSFSTSSAPLPSPIENNSMPSNVHINSEAQTTAATLRWAAARVDISPLALPSPEHELTDPLRGFTATLPGSHPPDVDPGPDHSDAPGGKRKSRRASFWQGTTDVEHSTSAVNHETLLSLSHSDPPVESVTALTPPQQDQLSFPTGLFSTARPAGASAPFPKVESELSSGDYFGAGATANGDCLASTNDVSITPTLAGSFVQAYESTSSSPMSVPALPRRVCLTRQTSSPLPEPSPREPPLPGGRIAQESSTSIRANRAAKEEQMFNDLGYLAPPNPPDELERRRALYKFNIWNTGPDLNFDRIAHLAKLVFSTKGVVISLIDGNEQWHKSIWGIQSTTNGRAHSICAHAILQRGDEPMVILDTHKDWRFAKNPAVTGAPHVRFYAGAPLRTADGYNIGALAVFSDAPREGFSPRQKHTLKEFAAIAMREMELWRDKIQLRIRDRIQNSMEQFSRECLEIDTEQPQSEKPPGPPGYIGSPMDKVYDRAAKLVKRTLDVEGVIVMDVSHCEVLESMSAEGTVSVNMHFGDPNLQATKRQLASEEYQQLNAFFAKYPDGKISEGIVPPSFRPFLPTHIQYALTVPIFNIDKRPFALLCAYNGTNETKRYLEGHELSYLRAIGVIILSAVLKRRMILADKAKSLFISNISHELRTPLHGILAAAELLGDSHLSHSQLSFLQTVQACGTSLVETVNHVLDFTKLSGNSKAGGVENVINPSRVDLIQLVEDAVDGSWIGHRARSAIVDECAIGSVYSPPEDISGLPMPRSSTFVETVIDIGYRREGWTLICEKGGIRRVLMNLFGNSLKFTSRGFVHVLLRELPLADTDPPDKIKVELSVLDTGKGISQNFLKNQLFHPFSQENPLQTGTGLGLAIVNSIVTSESVGGKVDVWSEEGSGTEIKVIFLADKAEGPTRAPEMERFKPEGSLELPMISLIGFDTPHEGTQLLKRVLYGVLNGWWGFEVHSCLERGDIVILNEDISSVKEATRVRDTSRSFIIITSSRGSTTVMEAAADHELVGGICRVLFKPYGPVRLRALVKLCVHAYKMERSVQTSSTPQLNGPEPSPLPIEEKKQNMSGSSILRRKSDKSHYALARACHTRPPLSVRSTSSIPIMSSCKEPVTAPERYGGVNPEKTITVGSGGSLLKSSLRLPGSGERRFRVLVVEDNSILRNLLIKWLSQKGYDFCSAVDGRDGVTTFEKESPFDVVLLDLSMPNLDGIAATAEIRAIESRRSSADSTQRGNSTRILALTGMSSLEDKRRAFEAGVDGYLVKPVAFKTLDEMFHKMGIVSASDP
ncbi:hypothetical protein E4T56_gene855 [Termitomyces sp. T112]|nr:hypothetical protein E4T56_gene855 [Termitomyces sp. T112]KAH0585049.1 hypothetical protein H2248_008317 [Termitomyces sp. 'cryptogamus']